MKRVKVLAVAFGLMLIISFLLFAVVSFVITKSGSLPDQTLTLITALIGSVACFAGGLFVSLCMKEKGILYGLACAVIYAGVICLVSVVLYCNPFTAAGIVRIVAMIISGSIGGILGVNRKKKVKF